MRKMSLRQADNVLAKIIPAGPPACQCFGVRRIAGCVARNSSSSAAPLTFFGSRGFTRCRRSRRAIVLTAFDLLGVVNVSPIFPADFPADKIWTCRGVLATLPREAATHIPSIMQDLVATAIELHEAGRLDAAVIYYEQALSQDQENAVALHLLGVLKHQRGDHLRAVELIGRAIALRPSVAAFHANLAEAYRSLGQFDRAAGCCRAALLLAPEFAEAMNNLGLALYGQNRLDEAAEQFRAALRRSPRSASTHNNLGLVLRAESRFDEALGEFRAAVECDPRFALAQTNLGQLLVDRNRAEEALPHCQEAVRLEPDRAELHHNLGNALRAVGRGVDARAAYLDALRLNPKLTEAHSQLGLLLQREGKLADAWPWLKQAGELTPGDPAVWEHLAELQDARDDRAQAAAAWARVVELSPNRPGPRVALGWDLQELGRLAEAADQYRAAIASDPNWGAAHVNLGGLAEELGDLSGAEASFREALRVNPRYALPYARLATLLRGKLPEADLTALRERLAEAELSDPPRSHMLFGLGHVLDARGDFAGAATSANEANALTLARNQRDHRAYVPADHERFVDRLIASFDAAWFARLSAAGSQARRPVFIFGLPRSGTTLIEQILASHSSVFGAGELRLARQAFEAIPAVLGRDGPPMDCVPALTDQALSDLAARHLESLRAIDDGRAARIVDKMPDNYLYVGLLAALFPRATFIHCRRDLRDVALSCWMTDFRAITWANHPEHLAHRFVQYGRVMDHWRSVVPVKMHEVDYEQTVTDLEGVARRLIGACELEWEPQCLDFHRTNRPVRTASLAQVRQPVYSRSLGRWKNYQKELPDLFARL
jgi:tetratricopeptide (TPR) repeat protein